MSVADFLSDRRAGFVMRWHARQTQRNESLAEHHYFVARDAMMIAEALEYYGIAKPDAQAAVQLALVHDEVEKETGDVSGEAKRRYPKLKKLLTVIEESIVDGLLFEDLPRGLADRYRDRLLRVLKPDPEDLEVQIVKYADKLEAYLFARTELQVGNTLMEPVLDAIRIELDELDWPWLMKLRERTGLP